MDAESLDTNKFKRVSIGRTLLILGIAGNVIFTLCLPLLFGSDGRLSQLGTLLALGIFAVACYGMFVTLSAMGYGAFAKVVMCIGILVPILQIVILIVMFSKSNSVLRDAGYRTDILGTNLVQKEDA